MTKDLLLGRVIDGKYRIDAEIGSGGMATIYRATRLQIDDVVAIKVLHTELLREPKFAERFQREAQAAARLKHPNVVAIYDFGVSSDSIVYIVMELVEGRNLRAVIREDGPMTVSAAAVIVRQVCAALTEAHRQHVIHRDIKPANIAVEESSHGTRVRVLDFGIANLGGSTMMTFTQTGTVMGTPAYMSPEQCMGEDLDGRSDIYSLGVVLFEMLSGVAPFNSPTATAVIMQHVQQTPPPLRVLNVSVSAAVEAVVLRALAKRREDRQQSARQLAQEFDAAVAGLTGTLNSDDRADSRTQPFSPSHSALTMVQSAVRRPDPIRPAAPAQRSRMIGIIIGLMTAAVIGVIWFGLQRALPTRQPSTPVAAKPSLPHRTVRNAYPGSSPSTNAVASKNQSSETRRFTELACGAIVDGKTGLEWLLGPDRTMTWSEAQSWVGSLNACGTAWRMPTIAELGSLYDPQMSAGIGFLTGGVRYPAHIDPIFSSIGSGAWGWSRESSGTLTARSYNFNQGLAVEYNKDNTTYSTRAFAVQNGVTPRSPNTSFSNAPDPSGAPLTADNVLPLLLATSAIHVSTNGGRTYVTVPETSAEGSVNPDRLWTGRIADGRWVGIVPLESGGPMGVAYALMWVWIDGTARFVGEIPAENDGLGQLTMAIEGGAIDLQWPLYGPNDARCCPSLVRRKRLTLDGIRLRPLSDTVGTE